MIWYFKEAKIISYSIFYGGIIIAIIFLPFLKLNETVSLIILIFIIIILLFMSLKIAQEYARKKMRKIGNILINECDPVKYIIFIDNIIRRKTKKTQNITRLLIKKSNALYYAGKFDEAEYILKSINAFPNNKRGNEDKMLHCTVLFYIQLDKNKVEIAEQNLIDMKCAIDNIKNKRRKKAIYDQYMLLSAWLKGIKIKGDFELIHLMSYESTDNKLQKVKDKYELGKIYLNTGRNEEAKEAFEYVIQNGNTLYFVQEAKEYLSKIGQVS